jgi:ElaB/YqjD/DUF883 family membrane-anchored ribosome-binding protein
MQCITASLESPGWRFQNSARRRQVQETDFVFLRESLAEVDRLLQAIIDATEKTARKRKSGEASLQEKRKQEKKAEERVDKRAKNLAEEKDVVKGEPIKPIEHLKED